MQSNARLKSLVPFTTGLIKYREINTEIQKYGYKTLDRKRFQMSFFVACVVCTMNTYASISLAGFSPYKLVFDTNPLALKNMTI